MTGDGKVEGGGETKVEAIEGEQANRARAGEDHEAAHEGAQGAGQVIAER